MSMRNVMSQKCKTCRDGVIVLYTDKGRREVTCSCMRGQERDTEKRFTVKKTTCQG